MKQMFGWKKRALRAEKMLQETKHSRIDLVVKVNGRQKERYVIEATRLKCAFPEPIGEVWASGDGSTFTIDIPVVVDP